MRLGGAYPYVFWLSLDGAAGMLLTMMRRRAREGRPAWHIRLAAWVILAASAEFNWEHAPSLPGAHVAFAMMPVIAGFLAEFAVADIRAQRREEARSGAGPRPERRVELARWLHPVESFRVMSAMAANASLPAAEATRQARADAAARALYRLRRLTAGNPPAFRVRLAEARAQSAFRRAGFAATECPEDVLLRMQVLVRLRDFAGLDYGTAEAAKEAVNSLIPGNRGNDVPPPPPRDDRRDEESQSPRPAAGTKESAARKWWDAQIATGTDPWSIEAKDINAAAGASEKSSFGRTFKRLRIAEMNGAQGDSPDGAEGEAAV
jgi:hypothetical protein